MDVVEKFDYFIQDMPSVIVVKRKAQSLATQYGFTPQQSADISVAASELATNLIKHAQRGIFNIEISQKDSYIKISLETKDKGPGFTDPSESIVDGISTSMTLGAGLGAVHRMMDSLDIRSDGIDGVTVRAEKSLSGKFKKEKIKNPYDIAALSRSLPGLSVNGDAFVIIHNNNTTLFAVIDGLGHGQLAHAASIKSRQYIETHAHMPLDKLMIGTSQACRITRGAVIGMGRLHWESNIMEYVSIGNIEIRILERAAPFKSLLRRGIVGKRMPRPVVTTNVLEENNIIILFSDGIQSHWDAKALRQRSLARSSELARHLMEHYSKERDDATVMVIKRKIEVS